MGGIKDRPRYRRANDREENTLAIDIAGRFKPGKGEEGGDYKYLLVATFEASRWNWKETSDEATEEKQRTEVEKEKDTDDPFHPQDPVQGEAKESEEPTAEEAIVEAKAVRFKGVRNTSSSSSAEGRRTLTEKEEEDRGEELEVLE